MAPPTHSELIHARHSSRSFKSDQAIPKPIIQEALELARHSASSSNCQPWRIIFLSGATKDRLQDRMVAAHMSGTPERKNSSIPEPYLHLSQALGRGMYTKILGIPRSDAVRRKEAVKRMFTFYGAPLAAIVSMHKGFGHADSLGVGMWMQIFLTSLQEKGVGSCLEVAVAGYDEIVREECGIGEEYEVLTGLALGYEDDSALNSFRAEKIPVGERVRWLG